MSAGDRNRTPISPVVWRPPRPSARARRKVSNPVPTVQVIGLPGAGSEDVLIAADGSVLTGLADGRILRISPDGTAIVEIARTGGRPLGLEFHPDGSLIVCDAVLGLLSVDLTSGTVTPLVNRVEGEPMRFCNNASIAADGTIYFSDSSTRFGIENYRGDLLEHGDTGRVFKRNPDGTVDTIARGLHFPNGVALAPDESYLLFAETSTYSVHKLWLTGGASGTTEVFIDNLPAFPDNIAFGSDGLLWIALPSTRNALLDALSPAPPILRRIAWRIPERLQPREARTVFTQAYAEDGRLIRDLQARGDRLYMCSGVRERDGVVWLGSVDCPAVGRIVLDAEHRTEHRP